jgi:hypothetical protein
MPQTFAPPPASNAPMAPAPSDHGERGSMGQNGGTILPPRGNPVSPIYAWPSFGEATGSSNAPAVHAQPTANGQASGAPYQQAPPAFAPAPPPPAYAPQFVPQAPQPQYPAPSQAQVLQPQAPPPQPVYQQPAPAPQQYPQFPPFALAGPGSGGLSSAVGSGSPAPVGQPPQAPAAQNPAGLGGANPPQTMLRDALALRGLSASQYQNDDQLLEDMSETLSEIEELRYWANQGRGMAARERANNGSPAMSSANGVAAPSQVQPPQPSPGSPAPAPQQPAAPDWRPEYEAMVRRDPQTGRFIPADNFVNPRFAELANERAVWERNRAQALISDPVGFLRAQGLDQILAEREQKAVREFQQQQQEEQATAAANEAINGFVKQNQAMLFQLDNNGQPLVNRATQQPLLSPRGQAFSQYSQEYVANFQQRYGQAPDPRDALQHAQIRLQVDEASGRFGAPLQQQPVYGQPAAYQGYQPQPQPQATTPWPAAQPAPQQQPAFQQPPANTVQQRIQQMNGAAYQPNHQGTLVTASQNPNYAQNPHLSLRQMLHDAGVAAGVLPQQGA